jgi:hypothetical protein
MSGRTLADSSFSHIGSAQIERVHIADWLFTLSSAEYQRCCPPAHIAAGATTSEDGSPMSINVEMIGDRLLVQNYVGEIFRPRHCRLVPTSDLFAPHLRNTCHVVWDLSVEVLDADTRE